MGCGQFCDYRVHRLSRAVNFSLLAGPNPSEQKPNQTNKRLVCSYIAQRQQQKLGSCYFELFCNGLSSIMTHTVATDPHSRTCTLHLRLLRGSSWTKLKSLVLPWESSFRDGGRCRGFIQLVKADYRYLQRTSTSET